jgi:hypothetical protein
MSSAHIHTATRNSPSAHAYILIAYIPVCKFLQTDFQTAQERKIIPGRLQARLFHHCMSIVLASAERASRHPVTMTDCYGDIRLMRIHPWAMIGDREEHHLNTCVSQSACFGCAEKVAGFGSPTPLVPRTCAQNPFCCLNLTGFSIVNFG